MSYIERLAWEIYALQGGTDRHGDFEEDKGLWLLYAMLCLTTGTKTTSKDVHDAWCAWAVVAHDGKHPALVPFEELSVEVQALDEPYRDAIRKRAVIEAAGY